MSHLEHVQEVGRDVHLLHFVLCTYTVPSHHNSSYHAVSIEQSIQPDKQHHSV